MSVSRWARHLKRSDTPAREGRMTVEFKRIMLPIDFSEHADRAGEYAAWFAGICGATVHLVHVIVNPAEALYEPEKVSYWDMVQHSEQKAHALLEAAARQYLAPQCAHATHVFQGDAYERLLDASQRIDPDLIVMST